MCEAGAQLDTFSVEMIKGVIHLKTYGNDNNVFYLCRWSIPKFSSIERACSKESQMFGRFTYSIYIAVKQEEVSVIIEDSNCRTLNRFFVPAAETGVTCGCPKYDVTVSTDSGAELFHETREVSFIKHRCCLSITGENFQKLKQLPNDTFVLTCRVKYAPLGHLVYRRSDVICSTFPNISENMKLETDLRNNAGAFLTEKVNLRIGEEIEVVNKAVLSAGSPVFDKKFRSDTMELKDNTFFITDMKMPVLRAVVTFMTSGVLLDSDFDFLFELYCAAHKYEITELHQVCIVLLLRKISLRTILRVLKLSFSNEDEVLKSYTMALISANSGTIKSTSTSDWEILMRDDPDMALNASTYFDFPIPSGGTTRTFSFPRDFK